MPSLTTTQSALSRLRVLPAATDLPTAGSFWGFSRQHSYRLRAAGQFPVEVVEVGARLLVRTADLARALGIDPIDLLALSDAESPDAALPRDAA